MTITVIQPAKAQLTAGAYELDKIIAIIRDGRDAELVTYIIPVEQRSAKHSYRVFEITQCISGADVVVESKRTTHYHKAIGIAVNMNA